MNSRTQAHRNLDPREGALFQVTGLDDVNLGEVLIVPVDDERQIALVPGLRRRHVNRLLQSRGRPGGQGSQPAGVDFEAAERIEARADRT